MSVLLEALKKAAAEKKALEQKNVESALRPVLSQRNQHKPASHKLSGTESGTFSVSDDAPLALDFNFDLDDEPVKASQLQANQAPPSAPAELSDDPPIRFNLKLSEDDTPLPSTPKPAVSPASTAGKPLNLKMAQPASEVPPSNINLDLDTLDDEFDSLNSLMDSLDEAAQSSAPDVSAKSDLLLDEEVSSRPTPPTQSSTTQPVSRSSDAPARTTDTAPTLLSPEVNTPSPTLVEKPVPTPADKPDITQLQHILNKATQAPVAKKPRSRWLLWLLLLSLIIGLVLAYGWLKTRALWTSSSTTTALDSAVSAPVLSSDEDLSVEAKRLAVAETQINDEGQLDSAANGSIEPKPISEEGAIAEVDKLSEPSESVAQICDLPLETTILAISPRASLHTPNSAPTKAQPSASQAQRTAPAPAAAKTIQVQPKVAPAFNEQAYQAYVEGDFAQAQAWYEQGLAQLANNKTSLLGLAAVAAQYGDWTKSINYYRQVLQHYPQDSDALQGIASIATALESSPQLKQDLEALNRQIPESAVLNFALGNVYAQEGDWFKAQQAYFDSVRLDMNNADYRLNLAISLDRLGQYELALTHYRAAIALQSADNARFDANTVAQRIQALTAFLGQGH